MPTDFIKVEAVEVNDGDLASTINDLNSDEHLQPSTPTKTILSRRNTSFSIWKGRSDYFNGLNRPLSTGQSSIERFK